MIQAKLPCRPGDRIELFDESNRREAVHVIDQPSILAVNAALATGRPLLLRGEPGTGKSQLARAVATSLGRAFVHHAVDARTETRDLLWTVDAVARLAEAQVLGALRDLSHTEARERIDVMNFVHPGPLWWAFDWEKAKSQAERAGAHIPSVASGCDCHQGVVVLVDEIDKADSSVPNGLLDALGNRRFHLPDGSVVAVDRARLPLVVITTNEERALPDAFIRRCLVHQLALPTEVGALRAYLIARGEAHLPACPTTVLERAADLLVRDRAEARDRGVSPPGVAEYIDLLHVVTEQESAEAPQLALLEDVSAFAYKKHPVELA